MNKRALLKGATAAARRSATLAAPGIVGLTAATANALPISQLQAECQSAPAGRWVTDYSTSGPRRTTGYMCYERDVSGNGYVDFYDARGNYRFSG